MKESLHKPTNSQDFNVLMDLVLPCHSINHKLILNRLHESTPQGRMMF